MAPQQITKQREQHVMALGRLIDGIVTVSADQGQVSGILKAPGGNWFDKWRVTSVNGQTTHAAFPDWKILQVEGTHITLRPEVPLINQ